MALIAVITRGEIFENYVIVIVLSMCIYVKNILEMIQKLYHWNQKRIIMTLSK